MNNKVLDDLIYLTACTVKRKKPSIEYVSEIDIKQLFYASKRHMMTAIVADALESAGVAEKHFIEAKAKAKRKCALFEIETSALVSRLEAEGIWYMLLKGSVLKE